MRPIKLFLVLCTLGAVTQSAWSQTVRPEPSIASPILWGAGLGIAGAIGGFVIGWEADDKCDSSGDFCLPLTPFVTAAAAGTVAMVIGVHLGNRRRGNLGIDLAAAALTYGAGIGAAYLSRNTRGAAYVVLAVIPVAQLGVTVAVERATGRRNAQRRVSAFVQPDAHGRLLLGPQIAF